MRYQGLRRSSNHNHHTSNSNDSHINDATTNANAITDTRHTRANAQKRRQQHSAQNRRRLPTLAEVLARRTAPPVDLYCLYIYLQREDAEDALDFWLDVQQHENLCKAYFADLRRAGCSLQQEWPEYYAQALELGSIYNHITGIGQADVQHPPLRDRRLRKHPPEASGPSSRPEDAPPAEAEHEHGPVQAPAASSQPRDGPSAAGPTPPIHEGFFLGQSPASPPPPGSPTFLLSAEPVSPPRRPSKADLLRRRSNLAPTVIPRDNAIAKTDLITSAERIYARYLLPGSEKEVFLPDALRIESFPISSAGLDEQSEERRNALARVPDMFHPPKEYVFSTMESEVFQYFLRAKAFGNLTPASSLVRLVAGLSALWAALATGFSFIFLGSGRQERCWVILPFSIAITCLISYQYELDPFLHLLARRSETTPFKYISVREKYVDSLLIRRSSGVCLIIVSITTALCVLFIFVPGKRL